MLLKHGDEIALGSTRARFDDGSGVALPLPPVGPGAIQNAMPPWPSSNATAPHSPQAMAGAAAARRRRCARRPTRSPCVPTAVRPAAADAAHARGRLRRRMGPPPVAPHARRRGTGPRAPSLGGTRVDVLDAARAIGTQIAAQTKGFLPFERDRRTTRKQLRVDYERLRITWELTRDIGLERDLDKLLDKILLALFKFINADRGVILLRENDGDAARRAPRAAATGPTRRSRSARRS